MNCQICGNNSGYFPLCKACNAKKDEGKIVKCDDCNQWYIKQAGCKCPKKAFKKEEKPSRQEEKANSSNALTCIVCGSSSNGLHFCRDCYYKYKDRSVDLRITNCTETQILDEYGNLQYKCADGRKVRSRAEMIINDFLFNNKIRAIYEETIYYKDNDESKTLHPDFYLPDYNIYLEYNELTNKSYLKSKEYTKKIYKQLNKEVIIMTDKELMDIANFLKPLLNIN